MNFVVRVLVTALALWLTSLVIPSHLDVIDDGSKGGTVIAVLLVALVFNLVNLVVKPLVKLLSLPLYILTLGLFTLVVNALMLWLTVWITGQEWFSTRPVFGLEIHGGFWWYVLAALIIAVLQVVIGSFAPKRRR
ncbi:phage holin family protein [Xylanimonas cellulosilytica]|nr:phage holin family protein [Xylanimonas cellulosilytica]